MADWVTRLAYSHEASSCGFWPGDGPVPEGFKSYPVRPPAAYYGKDTREFLAKKQVAPGVVPGHSRQE